MALASPQSPPLQHRWEQGSHLLGSQPSSHRWEWFDALPIKARHASVVKFPAVCCSFVNSGAEAVENSFTFWKDHLKDAFKPSCDFCGVCRDHLSRGRTALADVSGLRAGEVPHPEGPAPINQNLTAGVRSMVTPCPTFVNGILQSKIFIGTFLTHLHMLSPHFCQKGHLIE